MLTGAHVGGSQRGRAAEQANGRGHRVGPSTQRDAWLNGWVRYPNTAMIIILPVVKPVV